MDTAQNKEYLLASSEALLAGTLALMTGQAQASCQEAKRLMTRRICVNLSELGTHPALNPNFRAAVRHLREHWCRLDAELSGCTQQDERCATPWIPFPGTVQ